MRSIILAIFLLFSAPAWANDEVDRWLNSLPPMSAGERAAFDNAAQSMFHDDCGCYVFYHKDVMRKAIPPLKDRDRRLLIEGLKRNMIIPVTADQKI